MTPKRSVSYRVLVTAAVIGFAVAAIAYADGGPPSNAQIAFAQRVSDLMLNELVAALFTEFDETTPDNVEEGK